MEEEPWASGREGDVTDIDQEVVDAFMARKSIAFYASESEHE